MRPDTVGFPAGGAVAGFVASALIPQYGWQSVFYVGGAIPLAIAVAMYVGLPESLQFLAVRRKLHEVGRWLTQLDPTLKVDASTEYVTHEESKRGVPFVHLLRDGRAVVTVLLWVINFMNLLNLYSVTSWLPTVVTGMGYSANTAVLVGTVTWVGGTIGTFGLAWLIARGGFMPMLTATFAVATASIALIGQPGISLALVNVIVFVAAWAIIGGQPGINALSATYYPTYLRSTGVGWGLGIGRTGADVGPYLGGTLLGLNWGPRELFLAAEVPALISTLTIIALSFTIKLPDQPTAQRSAPIAH
jgi:AAHS family 4-hydroxybenzoate transporter-like MFS transporter